MLNNNSATKSGVAAGVNGGDAREAAVGVAAGLGTEDTESGNTERSCADCITGLVRFLITTCKQVTDTPGPLQAGATSFGPGRPGHCRTAETQCRTHVLDVYWPIGKMGRPSEQAFKMAGVFSAAAEPGDTVVVAAPRAAYLSGLSSISRRGVTADKKTSDCTGSAGELSSWSMHGAPAPRVPTRWYTPGKFENKSERPCSSDGLIRMKRSKMRPVVAMMMSCFYTSDKSDARPNMYHSHDKLLLARRAGDKSLHANEPQRNLTSPATESAECDSASDPQEDLLYGDEVCLVADESLSEDSEEVVKQLLHDKKEWEKQLILRHNRMEES
ncbi:uncharacterized protein PITG_11173 [Phytophthora infestans T30-4]|uniref:Uncharacterized protein n=1 Tax=Phytophthora infestans (strain T30-4) TaxID=403677 RepID=D0NGC7_PHYIT|nr:uncharacterized protein PITG_11173 [Phytophthora infestans T30-4]EEY57328.1 conserved hypothetical protein [Phytophthora infestans T30-4]|eukprot:XP_002901938.1 conserved hypothetical protein [Phytophthora infestans T30-4]